MNCRLQKSNRIFAAVALITAIVLPQAASAGVIGVDAGYDLYQTDIGTYINIGTGNIPLVGVPIGTYNFGGTIGVQNVGPTDTIVQRLATAAPAGVPGTAAAIPAQIDVLSLETAVPINIGAGLENYWVTLSTGAASTGTQTIEFATPSGGTFNAAFTAHLVIHALSPTGPQVATATEALTFQANAPWSRTAPIGAIEIPGANYELNGFDIGADFWPGTEMTNALPIGQEVISNSSVPEFSTVAMMLSGSGGLLVQLLRQRRARKA
jgi:hypothetical protein